MPSRDVNAVTRLAEASWRRDNRLNKGCRRDKFVIRSVTDVLRTQSRYVKCVGGSACGLTPINFTNLLWARSTSETDLITNIIGIFNGFPLPIFNAGYTLDSKYAVT